jgi:hypothetical protein
VACLAGAAAFDGETSGHFDDAGEQPQRGLQAAAARNLVELPLRESL